jgi:hypothetical protein
VNSYPVNYSISLKNDRPSAFKLSYDLDNINIISIQLDDNLEFELEFVCSPPSTLYEEQLIIQQRYHLNIKAKKALTFLDLLYNTSKFKTFLTLGTLNSITYESISFYSPEHYQELKDGIKYFHLIELFYNQRHPVASSVKQKEDYLFKLNMIIDSFEVIIKQWYGFDEQMAPILKHLIESISTKEIFDTGDFLIIVQALEGYCNRFRPNFPKAGKHITLKEQLDCLRQEFSFVPIIQNAFFDTDIVVNSRHYYSHFFPKKVNAQVADGVELYLLTQPLKILLICCVLTETGFNKQNIIDVINTYKDRG